MDASVLLIGAAIGALAGLVGYFAAVGAQRYWNLARLPYWIVVASTVVGIVGGAALLDQRWLSGGAQTMGVEEVLPYMQLIKQSEPALFERIETSIVRDQEDGMSADQVRANARSLVMSFVADAAGNLPDDLTYEVFATTRDQLAYLAEREEYASCADLALGRAKGDLDAKLSKELIERSNNNTVRVITALAEQRRIVALAEQQKRPAPAAFAKMPAEEFAQLASRSFAEASHTSGVPPEDVDNILMGSGEPAKTCKLMKAFFDAILAQPVDVAASALRTMASGERGASP